MITDTAFYRNFEYHKDLGDIWDRLDYERIAKVVQDVYTVIRNL